jgi:hypothetical protein
VSPAVPAPASPKTATIDPVPPRMTKSRIEAKLSLIDRENASEVEAV